MRTHPTIMFALLAATLLAALGCTSAPSATTPSRQPNILIIYTDDVGFGDVSAYNPHSLIHTPNIDALANTGLRFTSAYASSATCTPSRYSLLTGRYPFRNERAQVLDGDAPLLIEPGSLTIASHLRSAGYATAVIGKWHLGLGEGDVDWNTEISPGPLDLGFDHAFLLPATNDRVPCVYVEDRRVVNLDPADPLSISFGSPIGDRPTGKARPDLLRYPADRDHDKSIINRISRIGYQAGGTSAEWRDEDMAALFTDHCIDTIEHAQTNNQPWFIFFNLHSIHVPRAPADRFLGRSQLGIRGDAMLEADWSVGALIAALDRLGIRDDTIIIFSSDNGPVLNDGYDDGSAQANADHRPSGPFSGGKYDPWEGGVRIPFIINWPTTITPGVSDALVSQADLLPSLAAAGGAPLDQPIAQSLDGQHLAPTLLGRTKVGRTSLVTQSVGGLALRKDNWKYIPPRDPRPEWLQRKHTGEHNPLATQDPADEAHLFNLAEDPAERYNLIDAHPEIARQMHAELQSIVTRTPSSTE